MSSQVPGAIEVWKSRIYERYIMDRGDGAWNADPQRQLSLRAPFVKKLIRDHIPPARDTRILDLGCGCGAYIFFLKKAGYHNLRGVDVSAQQVDVAQELGLAEVGRGTIIECLRETKTSDIDVVLLMDVLEHMKRGELFATLDEVYRVLRPDGGMCISHVPNGEGLSGMRIRYGDLTHELAFSPESVFQLFLTIGFRGVRVFEDKPVVHGWRSAVRRFLWMSTTVLPRIRLLAETGKMNFILSQNMTAVAAK